MEELIQVDSSWIESAHYDYDENALTLYFLSGDSYVYENIEPAVFRVFKAAPSKGRFTNQVLKVLDV
jgi:hypothetical protein